MAGGINFKFPINSAYLETNKTTKDAIKENIKTLIMTPKGRRVVNPQIGTKLTSLGGMLFEQTNKDQLQLIVENDIVGTIEQYYPDVKVQEIKISVPNEDPSLLPNEVLIKIFYNYKEIEDSLSISLTR